MMNSKLPAVHLLAELGGNLEDLVVSLREVGFSPSLGFDSAVRSLDAQHILSGSVLIVAERSFGRAHRKLQEQVSDFASIHLVIMADQGEGKVIERERKLRAGLPSAYRHVAVVSSTASPREIADAAAGLVRKSRTDQGSTLLWLIDDEPARFGEGGTWTHLIDSVGSSLPTMDQVRVVRSLVSRGALAGSMNRRALVAAWREHILEPLRESGTPLVLVTDNHFFADRDAHLGERWAATVAQYLPNAQVFVASILDVALVRPLGVEGVWIGNDGRLTADDILRVRVALSEHSFHPATPGGPEELLSPPRARGVALSTPLFRDVWSDLLALPDAAVLAALHGSLLRVNQLSSDDCLAIRQILGWTPAFASALAQDPDRILGPWTSDVPEERRPLALQAWRSVLEASSRDLVASPIQPERAFVRLSFLAIATEWASHHGGLSTFSRQLCIALAAAGHRVACLVPSASQIERADADERRVKLVPCQPGPGEEENIGLWMPCELPFPPDFILGHGRVTGPPALRQAQWNRGAQRVHFFHMSPEEIEPIKALDRTDDAGDPFARAEGRMRAEVELCRDAALAVAVGPALHRELVTQLRGSGSSPPVHRLDPGFTPLADEYGPPPAIFVLVSGRVDDYALKGLDLAAAALGRLAPRARTAYGSEITLVVRGAKPGQAKQCLSKLRTDAGSELEIRIRNFNADEAVLARDFAQASLVLMPSRSEGFGLAGWEAIAAGKPVIISARSGLADLLEECGVSEGTVVRRTGSTVVDADAWLFAIDSVLRDRAGAFSRAKELCKTLAARCSWEVTVDRFISALMATVPRRR